MLRISTGDFIVFVGAVAITTVFFLLVRSYIRRAQQEKGDGTDAASHGHGSSH